MKKTLLKSILALAVLNVVFMSFFYYQQYLEERHLIDSLGLWYTIYSALLFTLLTVIIVAALYFLARRLVFPENGND